MVECRTTRDLAVLDAQAAGSRVEDTVADVTSLVASAILLEGPTLEFESPTDPG